MLSPPDIAVIGVLALIFFGPDQLPKVARKAGQVMREVQNTSQSFVREMERAADDMDMREAYKTATPPAQPAEGAEASPAARPHASIDEKSEGDSRDGVAHEDASGI